MFWPSVGLFHMQLWLVCVLAYFIMRSYNHVVSLFLLKPVKLVATSILHT